MANLRDLMANEVRDTLWEGFLAEARQRAIEATRELMDDPERRERMKDLFWELFEKAVRGAIADLDAA